MFLYRIIQLDHVGLLLNVGVILVQCNQFNASWYPRPSLLQAIIWNDNVNGPPEKSLSSFFFSRSKLISAPFVHNCQESRSHYIQQMFVKQDIHCLKKQKATNPVECDCFPVQTGLHTIYYIPWSNITWYCIQEKTVGYILNLQNMHRASYGHPLWMLETPIQGVSTLFGQCYIELTLLNQLIPGNIEHQNIIHILLYIHAVLST